eukprot:TRINITY_DN23748_c0_g1_i1.p1 TRINITY_DN23748_c0_g1~~TRINITY_DN23748_c0_g1_i1.p1  ORF type:complete len:853 (+),score=315.77 TRINITY_DN23748_c0_g1_i1:186-2744(+)
MHADVKLPPRSPRLTEGSGRRLWRLALLLTALDAVGALRLTDGEDLAAFEALSLTRQEQESRSRHHAVHASLHKKQSAVKVESSSSQATAQTGSPAEDSAALRTMQMLLGDAPQGRAKRKKKEKKDALVEGGSRKGRRGRKAKHRRKSKHKGKSKVREKEPPDRLFQRLLNQQFPTKKAEEAIVADVVAATGPAKQQKAKKKRPAKPIASKLPSGRPKNEEAEVAIISAVVDEAGSEKQREQQPIVDDIVAASGGASQAPLQRVLPFEQKAIVDDVVAAAGSQAHHALQRAQNAIVADIVDASGGEEKAAALRRHRKKNKLREKDEAERAVVTDVVQAAAGGDDVQDAEQPSQIRKHLGTASLPNVPGSGEQSPSEMDEKREGMCSGFSPEDGPLKGKGGYCDKWGWAVPWCFVDKDHIGKLLTFNGTMMVKESYAYPGHFFAPCFEGVRLEHSDDPNAIARAVMMKTQWTAEKSRRKADYLRAKAANATRDAEQARMDQDIKEEKAAKVRAATSQYLVQMDAETETARLVAWREKILGRQQLALLEKKRKQILAAEDKIDQIALELRHNVSRRAAEAARARQQSEEIVSKDEQRIRASRLIYLAKAKLAEDKAMAATELTEKAHAAEELEKRAKKVLDDFKAHNTTTLSTTGPPLGNLLPPMLPWTTTTTTTTSHPDALHKEAVRQMAENIRRLQARIGREYGWAKGMAVTAEASKSAEDGARQFMHLPAKAPESAPSWQNALPIFEKAAALSAAGGPPEPASAVMAPASVLKDDTTAQAVGYDAVLPGGQPQQTVKTLTPVTAPLAGAEDSSGPVAAAAGSGQQDGSEQSSPEQEEVSVRQRPELLVPSP